MDRLSIDASREDVARYFRRMEDENGRTASGVRTQLEGVVKVYELLYGMLGKMDLGEKVRHVMDASSGFRRRPDMHRDPKPEIT